MEEVERQSRKSNRFVSLCSGLASINSILFGYDVGVMSGAVLFIREDMGINDLQVEILISVLNFVSLIGSAMAGRTSDVIGRRPTMLVAALIFMAGAILMAIAGNYALLLGGRLVSGIGVGFAMLIAPLYTAELAPASTRGSFSCFPELFVNIGIVIGYIVNYSLQSLPITINWRIMLGLGGVPPLAIALAVLIMPESPRWLVMKNRREDALKVLLKTLDTEEEANQRLEEIIEDVRASSTKEGGWKEILWRPTATVKRSLLIALGLQILHQATGSDSTVYYSPTIFERAGITSQDGVLAATIAVGMCKLLLVIVAAFLIDRVGRRVLLMTSAVGMTASLVALAVCVTYVDNNVASVFAVVAACGDVGFFSLGIGPINWVVNAEVYPLRIRAKAVSLGVGVNRAMSGIVSLTFLSLCDAITECGTFLLFAAMGVVTVVFVYFIVPETKGMSLEEIAQELHGEDTEPRLPVDTTHTPLL